jgi:hypothetical protein
MPVVRTEYTNAPSAAASRAATACHRLSSSEKVLSVDSLLLFQIVTIYLLSNFRVLI